MLSYVIYYGIYLISVLVGFLLGIWVNKDIFKFKQFPFYLLLTFPLTSKYWLIAVILGLSVNAAYCDVKNKCEVYDIWFYLSSLITIIAGLISIKTILINIPLGVGSYIIIGIAIFIFRLLIGGSDIMYISNFAIACFILKIPAIIILFILFGASLIQMIVQVIYCKVKKIKLTKRALLPFLPALVSASSLGLFLYMIIQTSFI